MSHKIDPGLSTKPNMTKLEKILHTTRVDIFKCALTIFTQCGTEGDFTCVQPPNYTPWTKHMMKGNKYVPLILGYIIKNK